MFRNLLLAKMTTIPTANSLFDGLKMFVSCTALTLAEPTALTAEEAE